LYLHLQCVSYKILSILVRVDSDGSLRVAVSNYIWPKQLLRESGCVIDSTAALCLMSAKFYALQRSPSVLKYKIWKSSKKGKLERKVARSAGIEWLYGSKFSFMVSLVCAYIERRLPYILWLVK
jgi:hypothetical protein